MGSHATVPARLVGYLAAACAGAPFVGLALVADTVFDSPPGVRTLQWALLAVGCCIALLCATLPRPWRSRLGMIVVGSLAAASLAEVAARMTLGSYVHGNQRLHDVVLTELVPGSVRRARRSPENGGDVVTMRVNSDGFRGDELLPDPGLRIVVYGDSFIDSESDTPSTFPGRLRRRLAPDVPGVEVVNAGVSGWGPDQISLRLERDLPRLAPDLIIVALYAGNDYGDVVQNGLFRLGAEGSLQRCRPVLAPHLVQRFERADRVSVLYRLSRRLGRRAPAPPAEADVSELRIQGALDRARRIYRRRVIDGDPLLGFHDLVFDGYDADVSLDPTSESAAHKVALIEAVMQRISATARAHDVELVWMLIPAGIDLDAFDWARIDPQIHPEHEPGRLTGTLRRIAERAGDPVVDLYGPFRADEPRRLYLRGDDCHWNDAGQARAAEVMAAYLTAHALLDPR